MKNKLEQALLINRFQDIKKNTDRIYYGNEFCQNLIPALSTLKKWYFYAKSKNIKFTYITPFVTDTGLKKLEHLLAFLNEQENVEVVFNDWGVFKLIKDNYANINCVLGRLLTKQRRDPRIQKIFSGTQNTREILSPDKNTKTILFPKKPPPALHEHYRASIINAPIFQNYLIDQGITRVEIDNLIWEMDLRVNKKIAVSVYLPYGYIATTRICGALTLSYAACKKECKRYYMRLDNKTLPAPFYSIGNTVFYESERPSNKYLAGLGIDRIVYQPKLPF